MMLPIRKADNRMRILRRARSDAPVGEPLHSSFGKHLKVIQTIHAVDATKAGSIATRPIVASPNLPLSSTGGLMRDVQEPFKNPRSKVMKVAHHDAKLMMLKSHKEARKIFSSTNAKAGL